MVIEEVGHFGLLILKKYNQWFELSTDSVQQSCKASLSIRPYLFPVKLYPICPMIEICK